MMNKNTKKYIKTLKVVLKVCMLSCFFIGVKVFMTTDNNMTVLQSFIFGGIGIGIAMIIHEMLYVEKYDFLRT